MQQGRLALTMRAAGTALMGCTGAPGRTSHGTFLPAGATHARDTAALDLIIPVLVGAIIIMAALFVYFLLKVGDEDAPRPPSQPGVAKKGWLGWLALALLAVTILPEGLGFLAEGVNATTAIALLCAAPAVVVTFRFSRRLQAGRGRRSVGDALLAAVPATLLVVFVGRRIVQAVAEGDTAMATVLLAGAGIGIALTVYEMVVFLTPTAPTRGE